MTTRLGRPRPVRATSVWPRRVTVRCGSARSAASTASAIRCSSRLTDSMSTSWRVRVTTSVDRSIAEHG